MPCRVALPRAVELPPPSCQVSSQPGQTALQRPDPTTTRAAAQTSGSPGWRGWWHWGGAGAVGFSCFVLDMATLFRVQCVLLICMSRQASIWCLVGGTRSVFCVWLRLVQAASTKSQSDRLDSGADRGCTPRVHLSINAQRIKHHPTHSKRALTSQHLQ